MLAFVDESGDPGLKLGAGSSLHFTVVLLVFEDNEEAEAADARIELLRRELGKPEEFEFKFNKMSSALRQEFLEAIAPYNFFYFGIVINKRNLTGKGFQYKESFYKYVCGLVFENAKPYLDRATVVIDGSGRREFRRQLATYLRKRINKERDAGRCIGKVKLQDSKANNLLQLADAVSGAVHRSFRPRKADKDVYRNILRHREIFVQFWPKSRKPEP